MTARRVLIVEDEPIVQLHLRKIVRDAGHEVVGVARDAHQALALAERERPELALLDIQLPGEGNGLEIARQLRGRHACAIVFATAFSDAKTLAEASSLPAAGFVTKPFTEAAVRAAIATALAGHDWAMDLSQRERSLASVVGSVDEAIFLVEATGAVRLANARAAEHVGCSSTDVCGRSIYDLLRFGDAGEAALFRSRLEGALSRGIESTLSRVVLRPAEDAERGVDLELRPVAESAGEGPLAVVCLRPRPGRPVARRSRTPSAAGRRVLMYSHDTLGLGHLQRSLKLMRALLARDPELSVLLVTGSPVVHLFELPKGADYVKLPSVRKVGSERYEARSLALGDESVRDLRSKLLLEAVREFAPDLFLVDHAPIGMSGEVLPALEALRDERCTTVLGLRDIIDEPAAVLDHWRRHGIRDVLRELYDHVLVYGTRSVYDPVIEYRLAEEVAKRTHFAHYVCEASGTPGEPAARRAGARPRVLVSIGGGDGGSDELILPYLEMLERHRGSVDFESLVLTGPLLPAETRARIEARAAGLAVEIRDFVPSTTALFQGADLVVSTGGYNTVTQLLAHARRAIVVPRALHRQEQILRARRLEDLGLLQCLTADAVAADGLFERIRRLLASAEEPLCAGRAQQRVPLDGAERSAGFLVGLLGEAAESIGREA